MLKDQEALGMERFIGTEGGSADLGLGDDTGVNVGADDVAD